MEKDREITEVVFRVWKPKYNYGRKGEVIALFPYIDEGRGRVLSYMHIGQHGAADYYGVIQDSYPAKPSEYADLKRELENVFGYNLKVIKKAMRR